MKVEAPDLVVTDQPQGDTLPKPEKEFTPEEKYIKGAREIVEKATIVPDIDSTVSELTNLHAECVKEEVEKALEKDREHNIYYVEKKEESRQR